MFTIAKEILESCEALVTVEIEESAVQKAMQKVARNIARETPFPGFRASKVPYAMVVNRVGLPALRRGAAELLLEDIYADVLEKAAVEAVGPGSLGDLQLEPMVLKIRIPLMPTVELGNYSDLRLAPESSGVTDAELDEALEHLRHESTIPQPVSRPAVLGDQMVLECIEAQAAGEDFIHQHDVSLVLDPENQSIIPGLVEALVGLSAGEEKMFHLTLPADFSKPELRNADAQFTAHVESVAEPIVPALDDAFASVVGNFESLEELRADLRERMQAHKRDQAHTAYHDALVAELVSRATVRYPEVMLQKELDEMLSNLKFQLPQRLGTSWEDFLRLQGQTEEQFREGLRPSASERLTEDLVLREFARRQGITVLEQDLREHYAQLLERLEIPRRERRPFNMNLVVVQDIYKQLLHGRAVAELERLAQGAPVPTTESVVVEPGVVAVVED